MGREDVLGELRAALERSASGRGGLVTLTGPAGAGKTRTAEEVAAQAGGSRVLWAWCPPETAGRAFRPWSRLLRVLVAEDVACGRLVAASPPLRALVSGAAAGALRGADPETARLRLAGDVSELLATAARRRPLLLVLDDVHAADASSLRLLLETADAARTCPVLLLATARDEDAAWGDGGWARAQLLRRGRALGLGPLRERDVAVLVEAVTGAAPEADAVHALVRRTGGDAFFVTELLRAGSWGAAPPGDGGGPGVPSVAVRAAVRARLDDLTPRAARVLEVAAVLGTRFRLDVLAEAAEVPLGELRTLLGEAAGAGLLAEAGADRGAFRHDLLRDAVHDTLTPAERAALHHAAAEVLAGYARRGRDTGPAEVAHHLLLSGPEQAREAASYAREAAARAEALFAFEDAARWYERAVELWDGGAVRAGGDDRGAGGPGAGGVAGPGGGGDGGAEGDGRGVGVAGAGGAGAEASGVGVVGVGGVAGPGGGGDRGSRGGDRGVGAPGAGGAVGGASGVVVVGVGEVGGPGGGGGGRSEGDGRGVAGAGGVAAEASGVGVVGAGEVGGPGGGGDRGFGGGADQGRGPGPGSASCAYRVELVEALLGLGSARLGAGEPEAARGALLRAAGLAREAGRADLLARAALGLGTGPVGFEVDLQDREQLDLLTEARAALAAEPRHAALRAAVTARLSLAAGLVEPEKHRIALAEEAVGTAREAGDPATLGPALAALCDARPGPDHCRDRLDWSTQIVTTARDLRDPVLELLGRRLRLVALMETGDFAGADAEALAYETAVRPLRRPLYAWYVPLWRGARALMEGRYEDCAAALDEVEDLGRRAGSANAAMLAVTQRWCLYAETGDTAGLQRVRAEATMLERSPMLWPRVSLALVAAQFGRFDEAARRLSAVAPRLDGAPKDSEWLPMLAQAAETVAALGSHPCAPALYDLLTPYAGLFAVEGIGAAVRGPIDRHLALLAAAMGDPDRTREHRERALRAAAAAGAVALTERMAGETNGRQREGEAQADTPSGTPGSALFRREGPLWHLRYAGHDTRLPDSKGLNDIAVLLARPGTPVPAVELAAPGGRGEHVEGLHPQGDTGEVIDATARSAYRRRLRELEEEARDADEAGDAGRSERIAVERDALVGQLAAAFGIGGRVRRTGSDAERARTTVTARIRAAVRRIAAAHPELGRHLETSLHTGTLCVYQPEQTPEWRL
ncbi:ATP-binding protein [Streptomyces sp. NPDC001604]|uniref:ATP-binding protein n=1 Tax=Streptomyces sp. NPDC001604 TaxID=3364593 RepID=UPI0036912749